jgi:glycosyltransferase involved in cell wall biosynthesis
MKILFSTSTFPRWENDTQATFVFDLATNLQKLGTEVTIIAPHHFEAKKREVMNGLKVYRFSYFMPRRLQKLCYGAGMLPNFKKSWLAKIQVPFFFISQLIWTFYLVIKENPDYIHAHWIFMQGFTSRIVSIITRKPLIITAHGTDLFAMQKGYKKWLVKFASKNAKIVTVNSSATIRLAKNTFGIDHAKIIPMGIDTILFNDKKPILNIKKQLGINGPMILWVGRLVEVKGLQYGIEAMSILHTFLPDARLVVIGDGQEKDKLMKLSQKLKIGKSVIFYGPISNSKLPPFFREADLFLGTSITTKDGSTEAFGVVNLEALASSTPVVTTNVGGIVDIIKHNECGLLVKPQNAKALALSIQQVLTDQKLGNRLGEQGRKVAEENYSWPTIAQEFKKIYVNGLKEGL